MSKNIPFNPFELRVMELLKNATSMEEEHAPYRYIRQLVRSMGQEFYIYQGGLNDELYYTGSKFKEASLVRTPGGDTIGTVRPSIYWNGVRNFKEERTKVSLNSFMGK